MKKATSKPLNALGPCPACGVDGDRLWDGGTCNLGGAPGEPSYVPGQDASCENCSFSIRVRHPSTVDVAMVWNSIEIRGGASSLRSAINGYLSEMRNFETRIVASIKREIADAMAEASDDNYAVPFPRWVVESLGDEQK